MTAKGNNLITVFQFESKDGTAKVDALHKKLLSVNNDFNNLGKNLTFGKVIGDNSELAGKSVDTLKTKVTNLKLSAENQTFKPTISRHWENEAAAVAKSTDKIKTETDKLKNTVYTPGQPTGFTGTTPTAPTAKPAAPSNDFLQQTLDSANRLEKKTGEIKKSFQDIAAVKINSGNIGHLTKEIVNASENSRNLERHISAIKKEIANPNRKTSISVLTDDLRVAQSAADVLNRKLSALPTASGAAGRDAVGRPTDLRLSGFQKTNLSYQINDIATMAAMGANPTQILASQGGQIAQIFSAEQVAAFTAKYAALLPILGLGSAALLLTYKITGDIRDAAERRLKTEEKITATLNEQRLKAAEITKEDEKRRKEADASRKLQNYQEDTPIDQIKARKAYLNQILPLISPVDLTVGNTTFISDYKKLSDERFALENLIAEYERKKELARKNAPDLAFDQRKLDFKKNQEIERQGQETAAKEAERKRIEAAEKFKKSVEEGNQKVKELGQTVNSVFDSLYQKTNQSNPFVSVFSEADKSLKTLRENLKGLPAELQKTALSMQLKINANQLFETRLDNQLSTFDLRADAANFRNPYDPEKDKQQQERFIQDYLRRNPNYLYLKRQEFDGQERVSGYKNSLSFEETFRKDILKKGNSLFDTPENRLNKKLEDQFNLLYKPNLTPDQLSVSDRKFISLTNGVNPLQLTDRNREQTASILERQANRREKYEREALQVAKDQLAVSQRIATNQETLLKVAEKEGLEGIKNIIEIVDRTDGGARVLGATPTQKDMLGYYGDRNGLTNY